MASLVIKQVPDELHQRLKTEAKRHHRSMNKHVIALLSDALGSGVESPRFAAAEGRFALTDEWLQRAKQEGRP